MDIVEFDVTSTVVGDYADCGQYRHKIYAHTFEVEPTNQRHKYAVLRSAVGEGVTMINIHSCMHMDHTSIKFTGMEFMTPKLRQTLLNY